MLKFEHISGDYFMIDADSMGAPGFIFQEHIAAEFRIGANGIPMTLGMAVEAEMGLSGRIYFERISSLEG